MRQTKQPRQKRLRLREKVGLTPPIRLRLKQAKTALFGEEDVPRSKFGLTSLSQLHFNISPRMWRGKSILDKTVILSNLFNHNQTPISAGWSVQKTQVLDFRGKGLTYNSHNGTDFAIPVGSTVLTPAPGEVVAILSEFNRGGLKIVIDHGDGLMTCSAHLARTLVEVGDILGHGDPIALSGYSGLDGLATFPFGIPHVHFNVWLNAEAVDPFSYNNGISLWRAGDLPKCADPNETSHFKPSSYSIQKVDDAIASCKTPSSRERLNAISKLEHRAAHTIIEMNYYPTRFDECINVYDTVYPRRPVLDLPFRPKDFEHVVFLDEL